jgi:hypothetical protein
MTTHSGTNFADAGSGYSFEQGAQFGQGPSQVPGFILYPGAGDFDNGTGRYLDLYFEEDRTRAATFDEWIQRFPGFGVRRPIVHAPGDPESEIRADGFTDHTGRARFEPLNVAWHPDYAEQARLRAEQAEITMKLRWVRAVSEPVSYEQEVSKHRHRAQSLGNRVMKAVKFWEPQPAGRHAVGSDHV